MTHPPSGGSRLGFTSPFRGMRAGSTARTMRASLRRGEAAVQARRHRGGRAGAAASRPRPREAARKGRLSNESVRLPHGPDLAPGWRPVRRADGIGSWTPSASRRFLSPRSSDKRRGASSRDLPERSRFRRQDSDDRRRFPLQLLRDRGWHSHRPRERTRTRRTRTGRLLRRDRAAGHRSEDGLGPFDLGHAARDALRQGLPPDRSEDPVLLGPSPQSNGDQGGTRCRRTERRWSA